MEKNVSWTLSLENLALVAIDEARCISEWLIHSSVPSSSYSVTKFVFISGSHRGDKFRSAFRNLGGLRALTNAPVVALTASAPPHIEADIMSSLELTQPL